MIGRKVFRFSFGLAIIVAFAETTQATRHCSFALRGARLRSVADELCLTGEQEVGA